MPSRDLLNRAIKTLSIELHISGYQFCGPGTWLEKRLARGDRGINSLDAACRNHDSIFAATISLNDTWLTIYLSRRDGNALSRMIRLSEREPQPQWGAMKAKTKIGMSLKTKKKKKKKKKSKRILPIMICSILPVLPLLSILGSLVERATGVAKVINDSKAAQRQLDEQQINNIIIEQINNIIIASWKIAAFISLPARADKVSRLEKKSIDKMLKMSRGITIDMQQLTNRMRTPYFRGIFMRTILQLKEYVETRVVSYI